MTMTNEQIRILRAQTPACDRLIHFNNAGASLQPTPVYEAVLEHLALEQRLGGYEAAAEAQPKIDRFYEATAQLIGAQRDEIAAVENATRGWDMAFYAIPLSEGDRIITHRSEYASNYMAMLQLAERKGIEIDIAPSDETGQIDVDALPKLVTPKTKVLAITHAPSHNGLVNPAAEVGRIARTHGLLYLLDICQSAGQIDIDVGKIGCHMASGTSRKFLRGPRGAGFLYVAEEVLEALAPPLIDLRAATWTEPQRYAFAPGAKRFETFDEHVAGRIGFAVAIDYALDIGVEAIETRNRALASRLRQGLSELSEVVLCDDGKTQSAIVTFEKRDEPAQALAARLRECGVNISVSPKTFSQLDLGDRGIE
ncbi:MAG: aminotransferase class V-fold PLP-dependent enzyme, partial [Pseudomonadota bacterium]